MHTVLSDLWDGFWGICSLSTDYVNVYVGSGLQLSFLLGSYIRTAIPIYMLYRFARRGHARGKTFSEWLKVWIEKKSGDNQIVKGLTVLYVIVVGLVFTYFSIYQPVIETFMYFNSNQEIVETRSAKLSHFRISKGGYRSQGATVNALLTFDDNDEMIVVHFVDASKTFASKLKKDSYAVEVGITEVAPEVGLLPDKQPLSIKDGFYE